MQAYGKSHVGLVRTTNEDGFLLDLPNLFVVADGMGGHAAGEIASRLAVDTFAGFVRANIGLDGPLKVMHQAFKQANTAIYDQSQAYPEYQGMGTTMTAVYINAGQAYWVHAGDSRLYLVHKARLIQITEDHSLVGELVRNHSITKEEALVHPQRNILTRALGTSEYVDIDTGSLALENQDLLLLCTDGLTNMIREDDILEIVKSGLDNQDTGVKYCVDELIVQANLAGGLDNITAILIKHESDDSGL
ncbi:Stp1/IreP family PP2C-type Ser/Thr phosphatase [Acetonema longum]|uniref:Protein serine/threonine phosphatase n=1 Tax=Acetonema longum DSM 6540 TaxID=1009370 RepID=F7NLF0_9FIRM|nr:Stp1/IreP family PP2C-type Ser/Thr phosphatase [Acetonema longum]EGO63255.1 protein serine/threonine phosphatase [Acetonema longum DSM 6540]